MFTDHNLQNAVVVAREILQWLVDNDTGSQEHARLMERADREVSYAIELWFDVFITPTLTYIGPNK